MLLHAAIVPLSAQPSGTGGLMFDEIKARAENGDAALQYQLGLCYFNGNNAAKDYLEVARWWRKSADQDYAPAQYQFGLCCYAGYGVEQDYAESVKWWSKAAERGNAPAQYNLGCCYFYGYGVAKNLVAATMAERRFRRRQRKRAPAFVQSRGDDVFRRGCHGATILSLREPIPPTIHMTNDGEPGAGHPYDLPGVPWVSFFTGTGDSFHGTYWHNDYGRPRSHGCVNLTPDDAKFIYRWTSPVVPPETAYLYDPGSGTKVNIVSANS